MDNETRKLFGGFDKLSGDTKTLTVTGGFAKNNKHIEHSIVIGDTVKNFVKNKILEWKTFKDIYYENGKLDDKHYPKLIDTLNNIYTLPFYTTDETEILFLITGIYNAEPCEIINALIKSVDIFISLKSSIRHLFMTYKIYIEKMIEIYCILRNEYITHFNLKNNDENDFNDITARWNIIDVENSINTSSPILLFNFPPKSINLEKSIPKIIWNIKSNDPKHKKINNLVKCMLNKIKENNFEYIGYCPHDAIHRFQLLLKFPTNHLIKLINSVDYNNKYKFINCECNKIIKKVMNLNPKVSCIKTAINPNIKLHRKKINHIKKFSKDTKIQVKINHYEKYVDAFIQLYKDLIQHLIKKEKYINNLSIGINVIASDLQTFLEDI